MTLFVYALSAAIAGTPTHAAIESASWTPVTTSNHADAGDIEISKGTVEGVECFRAQANTDVSPTRLLAVVSDIEGAVQWSTAGVSDAKVLAKGPGTIEYYQYLDVPAWTMASDRFWFLKSTVHDGGAEAHLQWSRLVDGGAHAAVYQQFKLDHADAVEPTVNVGGWYFKQAGEAVTITYAICTQPGGSIPVAIQNAATRKTLPDTLGDVVREARRR